MWTEDPISDEGPENQTLLPLLTMKDISTHLSGAGPHVTNHPPRSLLQHVAQLGLKRLLGKQPSSWCPCMGVFDFKTSPSTTLFSEERPHAAILDYRSTQRSVAHAQEPQVRLRLHKKEPSCSLPRQGLPSMSLTRTRQVHSQQAQWSDVSPRPSARGS